MTGSFRAPAFHRRLHVRIGAVVLGVMVMMALGLLLMSRFQQHRIHLEVTQRLNLGLAQYIVEHQPRPLLNAAGEPDRDLLAAMAMYVVSANPAVEVYVLDSNGQIAGHALDGANVRMSAVDLAPVHELLRNAQRVRLPLLGDDPRTPGLRNVFSVAPIKSSATRGSISTGATDSGATDTPLGYLYVVLRGQAAQGLMDGSGRSDVMRETSIAVLLACALAGAALLSSLAVLTRPLRRLTAQVQAFRREALEEPVVAAQADEIEILQAAVHRMQRRIAEQFAQMEESDRTRRELVSNLSHDLKTPLTSIQGYAELCLLNNDRLAPHERAQHLRVMLRLCASLSKRIAGLFELSKLDAERMQPKLEVFCLAELLQDVIHGYQLHANARRVSLSLSASSETTTCVRADIALMERVFQNLIDNALRHTPAGGKVIVDVTPICDTLRVSVLDNGVGIASEHLAHIFERHYRAEDLMTIADGPSAGLGLAIVKRILDLHGSVIQVRSSIAQGTRFDFSLQRVS